MEHPPHLSPEQRLLRVGLIQSTKGASIGAQQAIWIVTGEAALLGLIIAHIDSISKTISSSSLKWGIVLLLISMLCGIVAKQLGMLVETVVAVTEETYKEFNSEQGRVIYSQLQFSPENLAEKISSPFLWPLRGYARRSFLAGVKDCLSVEKKR